MLDQDLIKHYASEFMDGRFDDIILTGKHDPWIKLFKEARARLVYNWRRKRSRIRRSIFSGIRRAIALKQPVRFMTLTSAPDVTIKAQVYENFDRVKDGSSTNWKMKLHGNYKWIDRKITDNFGDLNKHFTTLVKRIRKKWKTFEYMKIATDEGNGVLHILYKGYYIPQSWLSNQWYDIHNSPIVDIREVKMRRGIKGVANYFSNYFTNQGNVSKLRLGYSWNWIWKGWSLDWKDTLKSFTVPKLFTFWDGIMDYSADLNRLLFRKLLSLYIYGSLPPL